MVLNDVITMTALQSNRQHLEMVFDIDPKVPAGLIGDAEKISHVLKILVENSIKFTEEGGMNVRIGYLTICASSPCCPLLSKWMKPPIAFKSPLAMGSPSPRPPAKRLLPESAW